MNRDPLVQRYLGTHESPEDVVARWSGEPQRWIAHLDDTGALVGSFGLRPTGPEEWELGYRLDPRQWGCGLATEGARALVRYAFDVLGAERVWGQTMTVNVASRRVIEKAGLRYVRTFVAHRDEILEGSEHGDVEYELRRGTTSG